MHREIVYSGDEIIPGQKISAFLKSKGYSNQNMIDLKKDETSIHVNGELAHLNRILSTGEELRVSIRESESSEQILPVEYPLAICYEDEDLIVINKAAGMPIHPSRNNPNNSLGNALAWYYRGENFVYRCINRLDRDTSGLTVVAKHMVSGAILSQMVATKKTMRREYLAIVDGILSEKEGTIDAPIARKESLCLERIVDFERGESAVTHYKVEKEWADKSLVRLILETGRTHQIRVHMKYLGYPLIGDFLYHPAYAGNQTDRVVREIPAEDYLMKRQALHAARLCFTHPITGMMMEFEAPIPEDMQRVIDMENARENHSK